MFATLHHPVDQMPAMAWHRRDPCDEGLSIMDSKVGRGSSPYFTIMNTRRAHAIILCHNIIVLCNVEGPFFTKIYLIKFLTSHFDSDSRHFSVAKVCDMRY